MCYEEGQLLRCVVSLSGNLRVRATTYAGYAALLVCCLYLFSLITVTLAIDAPTATAVDAAVRDAVSCWFCELAKRAARSSKRHKLYAVPMAWIYD